MKKLTTLCALVGMIFVAGCTDTYPQDLQVYSFDTAIIQYELSGNAEGEETLYIRGDQKALHRFVTRAGVEENMFELDLGEEMYIADLQKMTAVKSNNAEYEKLKSMTPEEQGEYLVKQELGLKDNVDLGEPLSQKMVAGKKCDLYQVPNIGTACVWDGIVLEKEVQILDKTSKKVAVSVETNVEIPSERFELPEGVIKTNE